MNVHTKTFQYGPHTVTLETGRLARQADGAVLVSMGDTSVLVTAVGRKAADANKDGVYLFAFRALNWGARPSNRFLTERGLAWPSR